MAGVHEVFQEQREEGRVGNCTINMIVETSIALAYKREFGCGEEGTERRWRKRGA